MTRVVVVGEGQTEQEFVREVLAPALGRDGIFVECQSISTSSVAKGGGLSRDRVLRGLANTAKQHSNVYVTTFFDLYGLKPDLPGVAESMALNDPKERAMRIGAAISQHVVDEVACLPARFFAYIQPYEFEGLLFSDPARLCEIERTWGRFVEPLQEVKARAISPEHINDGTETHPSARLKILTSPRYRKRLHGPRAAASIGLDRIANECPHFGAWLARLRELPPLPA
jgi:hypothetical protein